MFCPNCGTSNDDSARFCRSCGTAVASGVQSADPPPPPPPVQQQYHPPYPPQQPPQYTPPDPRMRGAAQPGYPNKQYATGRSPGVALILSLFIVGVGQFYNGDTKKGLIMLVCAIAAALITFGLGWFAIAIWSAIDAYQVASGKSPLWS
jgi:TM2 domain-containing membrane protein YozV